MGSDRVVENFPGDFDSTNEHLSYSKIFDKVFPYYLSIGVSYDDFWNVGSKDFRICRYAKEAEQLRIKKMNEEYWWLSIYLRRTLLDVSPAFRDFHKGSKIDIECSTKEPMPMTQEEIDERKRRDNERKMNDYINQLMEFGMRHNAELRRKKEEEETQQDMTITIENENKEIQLYEDSISEKYKQLSFFEENNVSKETQKEER